MHNGQPYACLTMIWIASAMKFDQALEHYREPILKCAGSIADALSKHLAEGG
jgi:IclR family transcriptional regulator, mhp operon transcriptional activator